AAAAAVSVLWGWVMASVYQAFAALSAAEAVVRGLLDDRDVHGMGVSEPAVSIPWMAASSAWIPALAASTVCTPLRAWLVSERLPTVCSTATALMATITMTHISTASMTAPRSAIDPSRIRRWIRSSALRSRR